MRHCVELSSLAISLPGTPTVALSIVASVLSEIPFSLSVLFKIPPTVSGAPEIPLIVPDMLFTVSVRREIKFDGLSIVDIRFICNLESVRVT